MNKKKKRKREGGGGGGGEGAISEIANLVGSNVSNYSKCRELLCSIRLGLTISPFF
jgi:hypothetical protein